MTSKMKISIFSYFFISFVLDGLLRLSGLFVFELLQLTDDLSRQDAVVPFILSWVVSNIVGSFSFILNKKKYSEYIILFGVLLCATGTALCTLATDITSLIVCWGLLFGSGYGLASPHLSIRLKRENAGKLSSILQMTQSLGTTIMPLVFSTLTSFYALQGSFLIFCGIILNYLPLALTVAHDIEISIPNIKWRVRKKSSQYSVSKYQEGKNVSVESFINSLEPDLILEINKKNIFQEEEKSEYSVMNTSVIDIPPISRKRSETRGNDLQGLDSRFFPRNKTPSLLTAEIKKYEKDRNIFEENFIAGDRMEDTEPNKNYDITNRVKSEEKNTINCKINPDLSLKSKILDKITEQDIEDTTYENNELEKDCCKTCERDESNGLISTCGLSESEIERNVHESYSLTSSSRLLDSSTEQNVDEGNDLTSICELSKSEIEQNCEESNGLTHICELSESECEVKQNATERDIFNSTSRLPKAEQNFDENKVRNSFSNTFPTCDQYSSRHRISSQTEKEEHYQTDEKSEKNNEILMKTEQTSKTPVTKSEPIQSTQYENVLLSPNRLETKCSSNAPMVIKIHVEECTFTGDEKFWGENFNGKKVKSARDSYMKHPKSVKLDTHEHKLLDNPKFCKRFSKCSKLCKSKLSGIYSISESCHHCDKKIYSEQLKSTNKIHDNRIGVQRIVKYVEITTSRVWLSILLMSVIFKINLVTLLTIFADFGRDIDENCLDLKWILVAFGVGGFIGNICCCKISRVVPENYHAIGVVLFLLNGLSIAGILYSSSLNWLASFYCILGGLEGGITYIIQKFISEYMDGDSHPSLSSVESFFSGVAIMCIPYGIGLFRDEMNDYEFLLQILSCSSIFCAFLAYFLPYLKPTSLKQKTAYLRKKLENV